jgi:hypothetical protein
MVSRIKAIREEKITLFGMFGMICGKSTFKSF